MMNEKSKVNVCPRFEAAFQIIGKKWNGLIIESLLQEPLRFGELKESVEGISDRLLIQRLRALSEEGIVKKMVIANDDTHTHEAYSLTAKGRQLDDVFSHIHSWANEWIKLDTDA